MSSGAEFRGFSPVDPDRRITIVAEAGTAHQGSLASAKELIHAARDAGADAIKFQAVFAEEIVHPEVGSIELPGGPTDIYERFKNLEQAPEFYRSLKEESEGAGLRFLCSPFGPKSSSILLEIGVEWIKIASPELNYYHLLEQASAKPLVLSAGVSTLADIEESLAFLRLPDRPTPPLCLLHCVTSYPAPEEEYNVRLLPLLSRLFAVPTGISDHSRDPILVPVLAAGAGAVMIEKHLALSTESGGLDDPIALSPEQFTRMAEAVLRCETAFTRAAGEDEAVRLLVDDYGYTEERIEAVLGDGRKSLAASEAPWYGGTKRSLVAMADLEEGTRLTEKNAALLRCEQGHRPGLAPRYYSTAMGSRLVRPVKGGEGITWPHLLR